MVPGPPTPDSRPVSTPSYHRVPQPSLIYHSVQASDCSMNYLNFHDKVLRILRCHLPHLSLEASSSPTVLFLPWRALPTLLCLTPYLCFCSSLHGTPPLSQLSLIPLFPLKSFHPPRPCPSPCGLSVLEATPGSQVEIFRFPMCSRGIVSHLSKSETTSGTY